MVAKALLIGFVCGAFLLTNIHALRTGPIEIYTNDPEKCTNAKYKGIVSVYNIEEPLRGIQEKYSRECRKEMTSKLVSKVFYDAKELNADIICGVIFEAGITYNCVMGSNHNCRCYQMFYGTAFNSTGGSRITNGSSSIYSQLSVITMLTGVCACLSFIFHSFLWFILLF